MSDAARGAGRRVELTGLRRGTVRSMSMSAVVPQFTLQRDVPTEGLHAVRRALKAGAGSATLTDVITMACARALREHPGVNASYGDDCVMVHERVNIGLALALDDGLTVPVILDADTHALEGLAAERLRLAEAARTRTLRAEEIFAGTFSISNLGPLGVDRFQALVLPPQAAILAVGTLRDTVSLSGSFDHRAVDGAPAARFLATIARLLAEPAWALETAAARSR
jgi:pyruvate dehydrogenase E2 component (dihydrolipoyllysine-residue acetyltransferase)